MEIQCVIPTSLVPTNKATSIKNKRRMLSSHTSTSESKTTAKFREATVADLRAKNTTRRAGRFRVWRDVGGINGRLA